MYHRHEEVALSWIARGGSESVSSGLTATRTLGRGRWGGECWEPCVGLSPDGRYVAFAAATSDGRNQLWLRGLAEPEARPVEASANAGGWLFWSPDSRNLGYSGDGKLRALDVATGRSRVVCDALGFRGGAWPADGTILFAPSEGSGLFRVPAEGGSPVPVTMLDDPRGETSHRFPRFLPDGHHFLFRVQAASAEVSGIYIGSLDGSVKSRLLSADSQAAYAAPGFLLYVVSGVLFAHPFDAAALALSGRPQPLAQGSWSISPGPAAGPRGRRWRRRTRRVRAR